MNKDTENKSEITKNKKFRNITKTVVIPLTHDAVGYFWYAIDTTVLEKFPTDYSFPNTGWPMFLSLVFGILIQIIL